MSIKKRLIDAAILCAVFIAAVILFSYVTNKRDSGMTADMGTATLPQVSFACGDFGVNMLPGYLDKMDVTAMRDTITPVNSQRLIMKINGYENKIEKVSYTVYTLDGKEKLLERELKKVGDSAELDLTGENVVAEERVLEVVVNVNGGKKVHFYTRIIDGGQLYMAESLNYINEFHKNALAKAEGTGIGTALEPSEEGDNSSFEHVTIHSSYDHVTWGELEPVVEGGERWSIKETNKVYTSVMLEYKVRCKGEENEEDVYKVKEFFRVRHIPEAQKTYLLDYDRTMSQIFDPTKKILSEKGVLLGVTPYDTQYMVDSEGNCVSFIQSEELWNYNKSTDEISLVFSFSNAENTDTRCQTEKHKVGLLSVDKEGNTTFAVYGYMNRGEHEGQVGVTIYRFDIRKNSVEEKVFISSNKAYENAAYELGKLVYFSVERNVLYVMVDGSLYEIDVKKDKRKVLVKGLKESQYVVSEDGKLAAYQSNGEINEATEITVLNFEAGTSRTVECEKDECVRPLGFVKNDFVYGVANVNDTGKTVSGETVVPLYKVEIQNSKSKVIKTYQQPGIYVLDATFQDNMITLKRGTKNGETYAAAAEDYITNNEEKADSNITLESYVTELKKTQYRITYADGISDKEPKFLKPKQVLFENVTTIDFDKLDRSGKYYVYGYGRLQGVYGKAGTAIQEANAFNGVVTSDDQAYVWERGNRDLQFALSEEQIQPIREGLTSGQAPIEAANSLSDGKAIDLTGCSVEELLYIVNQGVPVVAMTDPSNSVIIYAYTESTVSYVETLSGERRSVSHQNLEDMTAESGHTYISYMK